jgi:hypothetical protein
VISLKTIRVTIRMIMNCTRHASVGRKRCGECITFQLENVIGTDQLECLSVHCKDIEKYPEAVLVKGLN